MIEVAIFGPKHQVLGEIARVTTANIFQTGTGPVIDWLLDGGRYVIAAITLAAALLASGHAIIWKREPRSAVMRKSCVRHSSVLPRISKP